MAKFFSQALLLLVLIFVFFIGLQFILTKQETTTIEEPKAPLVQPKQKRMSYYKNVYGKEGEELKLSLNALIASHKRFTYKEVWEAIKDLDEDPYNAKNVIYIYSGRSEPKERNAGTKKYRNDPDGWTREHVWPKSHGFPKEKQLAYTDLHHLRAADRSINTIRSESDFVEGGIPLEEAPGNKNNKTKDSFEPRDEVKGDVARMLFYIAVRYEGSTDDQTPDLELVDQIETKPGQAKLGKLCTLYKWNFEDVVSKEEEIRNEKIYIKYQHNRNPFIDHPEWVKSIWGNECS